MTKSKAGLITEIGANITTNANEEITGAILNGVLQSMVNGLHGTNFLFPKDSSLTSGDIGFLVMNDGSGTAKRYEYREASDAVPGVWKVIVNNFYDLDNVSFLIESDELDEDYSIDSTTWRDGTTPATPLEELEALRDFINGHDELSEFLSAAIVDDDLIIEETQFGALHIELSLSDQNDHLTVLTLSQPALPEMPTAFALGKLLGIDGDNAIISSNPVEVYPLEGVLEVNHQFFNNMAPLDFSDIENLLPAILRMLVIPADNGKVKALDPQELFVGDDDFGLRQMRTHFLGLAIASTANTVTVIDLKALSPLAGFAVNLFSRGLLKFGSDQKIQPPFAVSAEVNFMTIEDNRPTSTIRFGLLDTNYQMAAEAGELPVYISLTVSRGAHWANIDLSWEHSSAFTIREESSSVIAATESMGIVVAELDLSQVGEHYLTVTLKTPDGKYELKRSLTVELVGEMGSGYGGEELGGGGLDGSSITINSIIPSAIGPSATIYYTCIEVNPFITQLYLQKWEAYSWVGVGNLTPGLGLLSGSYNENAVLGIGRYRIVGQDTDFFEIFSNEYDYE